MVLHARHRQPRGDEVAEALALSVGPELVDRGTEETLEARQQRGQLRGLVTGCAGQAVEALGDLLQAQHIEVAQHARAVDDALRAHRAVEAATPLRVPGDELHCGTPAPPQLLMNGGSVR
jgi:hypothetical protein